MARGGHARDRPGAAPPLRGPRRRRRAPRPPPRRGLETTTDGAAAQGARPDRQGNPRDNPRDNPKGVFVTVEGVDFSGKSTLVRAIKPLLAGGQPPTHFTREPGGTLAAERIRELVLDPGLEMDAWTEAYLYAAARADHVRGEIAPRLLRGENVLCERYLDSSVAYQGHGRGLGAEAVRGLNDWAVGETVPDRTFYLRLDAAERERRAREMGAPLDRIERVGDEFVRKVAEGFEELARREPGRVKVLDAARSPEELAEMVVGEIRRLQYTEGNVD